MNKPFAGYNLDMNKAKIAIGCVFVAIAILIVVFGLPSGRGSSETEFLRLHIRANSNSHEDQAVKYLVKQEIIDSFTPIFSQVTTRVQALRVLGDGISDVERIGSQILRTNGFSYGVRATLRSEHFPTRNYHGLVLPAGYYDALIIELGAGQGDNWWCVVYPPLCFLNNNIGGERGVVYRSRLQEIINRFF